MEKPARPNGFCHGDRDWAAGAADAFAANELPVVRQPNRLGTRGPIARSELMADYTFYVLESDGYLIGGVRMDCLDDAAALALASELLGKFKAAVEVWRGSRRLDHFGVSSGLSEGSRRHRNRRTR